MKWQYTKSDKVFDGFNLDEIMMFLQNWPDGQRGTIEIKKSRESKTKEQLAYYYSTILPTTMEAFKQNQDFSLIIELGDKRAEIELTQDNLDMFLKTKYAKFHGEFKDKSEMSIEECSKYIDWCIKWVNTWLGCSVPPAEKDRK